MNRSSGTLHLIVGASVLVCLLLSVYPLPSNYIGLRPEFLCLVMVYWVTHIPQHIGVFYAWFVGLAQDIVEGSVWGGHALALAVVAYICLVSYQRIKNYSVWHQSLWVVVLVGLHQLIVNGIQGLAGYHSHPHQLLLSIIISAMFWPVLHVLVSRVRHLYRVAH